MRICSQCGREFEVASKTRVCCDACRGTSKTFRPPPLDLSQPGWRKREAEIRKVAEDRENHSGGPKTKTS